MVSRCGICGFELLPGDRVVIGTYCCCFSCCFRPFYFLVFPNANLTQPLRAVEEDGRRHEGDLPFVSAESTEEEPLGVECSSGGLEQWHPNFFAVGCHVECMAREPCPPPNDRFQAMAYGYSPRPAEVERRERWLRSQLGTTLHAILGRRFSMPLELCELIAAHSHLREWAAAASRAFWDKYSATPAPREHRFGISSDVWARHVEFEGVRYIAQLTNESGRELASFSLVYMPTPGKRADTLYVAEDYLGIRDILFASSPATPLVPYDPGVWWKRLKIPPGYFLGAWTDVGLPCPPVVYSISSSLIHSSISSRSSVLCWCLIRNAPTSIPRLPISSRRGSSPNPRPNKSGGTKSSARKLRCYA